MINMGNEAMFYNCLIYLIIILAALLIIDIAIHLGFKVSASFSCFPERFDGMSQKFTEPHPRGYLRAMYTSSVSCIGLDNF